MSQSKMHNIDVHALVHELAHYLPAQAPLKDFIHHNTLHAFQHENFYMGIRKASKMFGYQVNLPLEEFRALYAKGKIKEEVLLAAIKRRFPREDAAFYLKNLTEGEFPPQDEPRIGKLRYLWKEKARIDLDAFIQPRLFRILSNFLDQGISVWKFPVFKKSFLGSIRELEKNSAISLFKSRGVREKFLSENYSLIHLLQRVVGNPNLYRQYMYDQQFAHQGWSGMVASIEANPSTLLDKRRITLEELITFEFFLEMDALEDKFGEDFKPLSGWLTEPPKDLFAPIVLTPLSEALAVFQEALEFSYFDDVLAGVKENMQIPIPQTEPSFQAMFCIDDRECSIRRYLELEDPECVTYGTAGFFNVAFYFQPEDGKFLTKLCPAPVTPTHLIKESGSQARRELDPHFTKHSHKIHSGWIISQTLGFWSAIRLFFNIFRPTATPASASSFKHMDKKAHLSVENRHPQHHEQGLQVGFTIGEMADRVEGLLRSIGLIEGFAPIVYVVGHGSSSTNNPHYAAYDCGACSGRPGSVNARVICHMANHPEVRNILAGRGIFIPGGTVFVGALHDTTRDDIEFFDVDLLAGAQADRHKRNHSSFLSALDRNAKERSRRFESINTRRGSFTKIHEQIRLRSVSLFEPRPELNHATNALCIVGRRHLSKGLFLDRRSFLNSYDYRIDPEGQYLFGILKAVAPVCGGINLEYYFSRTDNQKLGAGTKLPHNVMGLFGVANGIDGDLRPGLPSQMIEVHDPLRLLTVVEHYPEVVLKTLEKDAATLEWFANEWIHLFVIHPDTQQWLRYAGGRFEPYTPHVNTLARVDYLEMVVEDSMDNLSVFHFNQ